jgi:preprotein translocase subunit YajC
MSLLFAAAEPQAQPMSMTGILIMYALIFFGLWFFFMRPQSKKQKQMAAMLASLEVGDYVLTTSGFYGVVIDINDDTVIVEFGNNKNCRIPMQRNAITNIEKPEA